ncbi:diaminopimelate epimerase [Legionella quinlivanii]|uniref:diaminopimelate epimerase n=1 Tax=Legionella quinlivanii TaxID=45073 RepID=UPI002243F725|nr:diaminopimelate epimerase [Legionella quinlivanii]MCW8451980.1 diaminopimelate epimerase [Legionella quinlivanii]
MSLKFTKMHGLGNDFIVIDAINQTANLTAKEIITLSDRHRGIGFDQCLIVEPSKDKSLDFFYRIINADGQEVGQCGNGARCIARFLYHYGLTTKKKIRVGTHTTTMQLILNKDDSVTIEMPPPSLNPREIPFLVTQQQDSYILSLAKGNNVAVHAISVGNPHAVTLVNDIQKAPVNTLGEEISFHPLFPEQVNAEFMEIITNDRLQVRVYERGCGETQACGSGAVAAAAIGRLFYQMEETIQVDLPGGELHVKWQNQASPIYLTGPATFVYEGTLLLCG